MITGRYTVAHDGARHVLVGPTGGVCCSSARQGEVIRRAQELSGFTPADGSPETYGRQLAGLDDPGNLRDGIAERGSA